MIIVIDSNSLKMASHYKLTSLRPLFQMCEFKLNRFAMKWKKKKRFFGCFLHFSILEVFTFHVSFEWLNGVNKNSSHKIPTIILVISTATHWQTETKLICLFAWLPYISKIHLYLYAHTYAEIALCWFDFTIFLSHSLSSVSAERKWYIFIYIFVASHDWWYNRVLRLTVRTNEWNK